MRRDRSRDETDFGQAEDFRQLLGEPQMRVVDRIECAAQDGDRSRRIQAASAPKDEG
jgi:hypothetical protein